MKRQKIFSFLIAVFLFSIISCMNNPEGTGTVTIDSNSDNYYIKAVYARRIGELNFQPVWSSKNSDIDRTSVNVYLEPGVYHIYCILSYGNILPTFSKTLVCPITVTEDSYERLKVSILGLVPDDLFD